MATSVRIPSALRSTTSGQARVTVEGSTVGDTLDNLEATYPALKGRLRDDAGAIAHSITLFVGGEDVRLLAGLSTPVEGSEISIFPTMAHTSMDTDLPDLSREYAVPASHIARYQRDGHVLLRRVASPAEIAAYRPSITDTALRLSTETRPLAERDTFGKAFLQVLNLWEHDEAVRRFVLARRFAQIAADLMGVDAVRIFHDQALYKEPGGGFTPWHQDQIYWPVDTPHMITMWMPLVTIPTEVGSLTFVSGSHALDYHSMLDISDHSEEMLQQYVTEHDLPQSTYGAMAAGDATFHAGWTMHRAPSNPTELVREVLTIIYYADGARLLEHPHALMEEDLEFFPGFQPGGAAVGPRTPLVYKRP